MGLDWSTTFPHSLFYLPCQASNPANSFFNVYFDSPRQSLNPSLWLENTVIPLQPELESLPAEISSIGINSVLVEQAKAIWRGSIRYPGKTCSSILLWGLDGMSLAQIEAKLREEAAYGRSPSERLAQIPSTMASLRKSFVRGAVVHFHAERNEQAGKKILAKKAAQIAIGRNV